MATFEDLPAEILIEILEKLDDIRDVQSALDVLHFNRIFHDYKFQILRRLFPRFFPFGETRTHIVAKLCQLRVLNRHRGLPNNKHLEACLAAPTIKGKNRDRDVILPHNDANTMLWIYEIDSVIRRTSRDYTEWLTASVPEANARALAHGYGRYAACGLLHPAIIWAGLNSDLWQGNGLVEDRDPSTAVSFTRPVTCRLGELSRIDDPVSGVYATLWRQFFQEYIYVTVRRCESAVPVRSSQCPHYMFKSTSGPDSRTVRVLGEVEECRQPARDDLHSSLDDYKHFLSTGYIDRGSYSGAEDIRYVIWGRHLFI